MYKLGWNVWIKPIFSFILCKKLQESFGVISLIKFLDESQVNSSPLFEFLASANVGEIIAVNCLLAIYSKLITAAGFLDVIK